jgi:hypothetical protein
MPFLRHSHELPSACSKNPPLCSRNVWRLMSSRPRSPNVILPAPEQTKERNFVFLLPWTTANFLVLLIRASHVSYWDTTAFCVTQCRPSEVYRVYKLHPSACSPNFSVTAQLCEHGTLLQQVDLSADERPRAPHEGTAHCSVACPPFRQRRTSCGSSVLLAPPLKHRAVHSPCRLILYPEDGGIKFIYTVGKCLTDRRVTPVRRQQHLTYQLYKLFVILIN